MNKIIAGIVVLILLVGGLSIASNWEKVPAGHVGVKVYLLGGSKGVDNEVIRTGRTYVGWNEELYLFPTFSQNDVWKGEKALTFGTTEGLSIGADLGITYAIQPDKVALVFQKYRKGVDEITDIYLRNMVRDALVKAASTRGIESIYGAGKADLIEEVEGVVRNEVKDIGIIIERVYWVGDLRLPPPVTASINAKIQATQISMQRENEIKTAEAEAAIKVAAAQGEAKSKIALAEADATSIRIKGDAQASAISARAKALATNDNLVELTYAERWNGILPTTMLPNSTVPFFGNK